MDSFLEEIKRYKEHRGLFLKLVLITIRNREQADREARLSRHGKRPIILWSLRCS